VAVDEGKDLAGRRKEEGWGAGQEKGVSQKKRRGRKKRYPSKVGLLRSSSLSTETASQQGAKNGNSPRQKKLERRKRQRFAVKRETRDNEFGKTKLQSLADGRAHRSSGIAIEGKGA